MKLIQLTGAETLGIKLSGSKQTNDPTFVVEYHDETPDNIISYSAKGETNGTNYVEMVAASADGYTRVITEISIVNIDDKTHIVNLLKVDDGDEYPLFIRSVDVNGELHLAPSAIINVQSGGDSLWEADGEAGIKPKDEKTVDYQYIVNGPTTTDELVKYNALDSAAGYLADKTVAGTGITLAEGTGGDVDKLKITNSDTGTSAVSTHESTYDHDDITKVKYNADDAAAGYLADKIVAGTGITLEEGTGGDADKLKIIGTAVYTLPLAGAARGGIKADAKGEGDTVEIKIDGTSEKLYAPAYPAAYTLPLASATRGGIKAATKGEGDTVECKIDESGEKLYVPAYPTVYWQRNSTVLSPANAGDSVTIDNSAAFAFFNFISYSDFGSAYVGQNKYAVSPINLYSKTTAETNALGIISAISHSTSETAADGFGVYDEIQLDSTTTPSTVAAQIVTKWSTAAHATATSIREWWLKGAGAAIARVFAMTGLGQMLLDKYGSGTFTGTVAKWLGVTSAGAVIELTPPDESKWTRTSTKLTPKTANDIVEVNTNDASNPAIKGITSAALKAAIHGDGGAAGYGVYGEAQVYGGYFKGVTAGNGLLAEATAGIGAAVSNTSTTVEALRLSKNTAATDALVPFAVYNLNSTGTAAAGLGVKIAFNIEDAAGSSIEAGYQAIKWSAATAGSVSSVWEWYHYRAGTPELTMSVLATGQLVLPLYTGSSFSGTVDKILATDTSGNVIRTFGIRTGAALPATPIEGELFLQVVTGRSILYQYAASKWNPMQSYGAMTLYVDATDGTDDTDHGTASGEDAFASIQYAFNTIPPVYSGNVMIYLSGEAYSETCILQGKSPSGNYSITIQGTINTVSSHTMGTGNLQGTYVSTTQHQYAKVVRGTGTWSANEVQNKWVIITSGNNNGEYALIDSNDTTAVRPLGKFVGGSFADSTDTFDIQDLLTSITDLRIGSDQKNVVINDIDINFTDGTTNQTLFGSYSQVELNRCSFIYGTASNVWVPAASIVIFRSCYFTKVRTYVRHASRVYFDGCKWYLGNASNVAVNYDEQSTVHIGNGCIIESASAVVGSSIATFNLNGTARTTFRNTIRMATTGVSASLNSTAINCDTRYVLFGNDIMPNAEEAATSTSAGKLVDTSVNFTTIGVAIGDKVVNLTDRTSALVTNVDSATQLTLASDIMASGEKYRILAAASLCTTETTTATGGQIA